MPRIIAKAKDQGVGGVEELVLCLKYWQKICRRNTFSTHLCQWGKSKRCLNPEYCIKQKSIVEKASPAANIENLHKGEVWIKRIKAIQKRSSQWMDSESVRRVVSSTKCRGNHNWQALYLLPSSSGSRPRYGIVRFCYDCQMQVIRKSGTEYKTFSRSYKTIWREFSILVLVGKAPNVIKAGFKEADWWTPWILLGDPVHTPWHSLA